jgi:hypothetical protein
MRRLGKNQETLRPVKEENFRLKKQTAPEKSARGQIQGFEIIG